MDSPLSASLLRAAEEPAGDLRSVVSQLGVGFLARLESAMDPGPVCSDYESELRQLIVRHSGRPEPYIGFCELFEKGETDRSRLLLREFTAAPALPEAVRTITPVSTRG